MKVVHTIESVARATGGPAQSVPAICAALAQCDVEVSLIAKELVAPEDLRRAIRRVIRSERPDLVHDHGVWLASNHTSVGTARRCRIPLVVSPRGMLEPWPLKQKPLKKMLAWYTYECRDLKAATVLHATALSEATQLRLLGLTQPIAVIPNGVNVPQANETRGSREVFTALFLSRIHKKKGLSELIHAWDEVRPRHWRLVIAGPVDNEEYLASLKALIQNRRLAEQITFHAPVYDVRKTRLFHGADLFVLPTHSENFGIAIAEALAHGLPVITTRNAPWESLETERSGWWIDLSHSELVNALASATSLTDDERVAMGARGRAYVRDNLSWSSLGVKLYAVYRWILDGGSAPDVMQTR